MKTVAVNVRLSPRHNGNPDNGPVGIIGVLAEITWPMPKDIIGSPLGRGTDKASAIADLIRRVGYESKVELVCTVTDDRVIPLVWCDKNPACECPDCYAKQRKV